MWFNPMMRRLLRSPLHSLVSKNMMLISYTGRKSGRVYATPIGYLKVADGLHTISSRERVWWRNLRGGADVTLRLQGRDVGAWATAIEDPARISEYLSTYARIAPAFARALGIRIDQAGTPSKGSVSELSHKKVIVVSQPQAPHD